MPNCPTWLGREAKREWRRLMPILEKHGLVTELDRGVLAQYCAAYERWWKAEKAIQKHGLVQESDSGWAQQRPEVSMADNAIAKMRSLAMEMGFTPRARQDLGIDLRERGDRYGDDSISAWI